MDKRVQFPESFAVDVARLISFLTDYDLGGYGNALRGNINEQLTAKFEAMDRRNAFTKYKTAAPGSQEREKFRKEYLQLADIHRNWISPNETIH